MTGVTVIACRESVTGPLGAELRSRTHYPWVEKEDLRLLVLLQFQGYTNMRRRRAPDLGHGSENLGVDAPRDRDPVSDMQAIFLGAHHGSTPV